MRSNIKQAAIATALLLVLGAIYLDSRRQTEVTWVKVDAAGETVLNGSLKWQRVPQAAEWQREPPSPRIRGRSRSTRR